MRRSTVSLMMELVTYLPARKMVGRHSTNRRSLPASLRSKVVDKSGGDEVCQNFILP